MPATRPPALGEVLAELEGLPAGEVASALRHERLPGERIGATLVRIGKASTHSVARALARQLHLPLAEAPLSPETTAIHLVDEALARQHLVCPLKADEHTLTLAMADPLDSLAMENVRFQTGRRVEAVVGSEDAVRHAIEEGYRTSLSDFVASMGSSTVSEPAAPSRDELERATRRAPVVRLVDRILREAVDGGASDIHIEETGSDVRVRLRVDGVLRPVVDLPASLRRTVLSRIKVLAGMDIAVRRRPQDGRTSLTHAGRALTLRVSTLPVGDGEKAVVRILDAEAAPKSLDALGMSDTAVGRLRSLLGRGEGVVLAAGPTGSGKSTTLFAALSEIDREAHNVVTLEDPVEYRLTGASQVQVDRRAGLGFPDALRSVLRQDPDVVMVGEIRDRETAEIAMAAAVTGHLVLSTIHTTDAPGAITRLLHMGVPPFLVAGGLTGVIAQRLVRRCCAPCRGAGCEGCGDGHAGRTGVYQLLTMSDALRDEITGAASSARIRRLAVESGMRTLESDARRAVAFGLTTPLEVSRVARLGTDAVVPCVACGDAIPMTALACPSCGTIRRRLCLCGQAMERGWRYCPWCIRKVEA
jgi:type IV pilus assembly protein PilB